MELIEWPVEFIAPRMFAEGASCGVGEGACIADARVLTAVISDRCKTRFLAYVSTQDFERGHVQLGKRMHQLRVRVGA